MSDGSRDAAYPHIPEDVAGHRLFGGRDTRWQAAAEVFFIFVVFFVHAGWPVPDVNESHYLCKAKQYWNPAWLPGDFFLNTADAHLVFYWTFGWLTRWLSLPAFAWVGRVLIWALTAWAWRRLSFTLIPLKWYAVLTAAPFVIWSTYWDLSGEWVIGGMEAKGPAYALVLFGLERLARQRWNTALILLGAASAFHVLVGGWTVVAVAVCWLCNASDRPPLWRLIPGLAGGLLLALPGILPALWLSWDVPDDVLREANQAYVLWRLKHHLLPHWFKMPSPVFHVGLIVCGVMAYWLFARADSRNRLIGGVMLGAILISAAGYVVAWALQWHPPLLAAAMRFYWFRLADAMVPVCAAIWWPYLMWWGVRRAFAGPMLACLVVASVFVMVGWDTHRRFDSPSRADNPKHLIHVGAWIDVCQAAKEHTPPNAVFLTPRFSQTFHWHAQRAEVVNHKDIPQDAKSIVEWRRRLVDIHKADRNGLTPLSYQGVAEVRRLAKKYKADFVITRATPRLDLPRLHWNRDYALYDVRK